MKIGSVSIDLGHAAAFLAIVLPPLALGLTGQFTPGSAAAITVTVIGAIGMALKASISPAVTEAAALKNAATSAVGK